VRYADAEAFRAALEARLRQAAAGDQDLARRRRTIAFDRFLARLAASQGGAWILKGGAALEFRMPDRARATRDIDLAFTGSVDPADQLLDDLEADPFGDHFSFRVTRRRELSEAPDRGVVTRLSIEALLGGRIFERFVVDLVGTDGASTEPPERVELGNAFAFADLPVVELAVLDLRTHWAEKLSAYLRRYDNRPNTRVKDLVDLVLLIEHGLQPDARLHEAVTATFDRRQQELPGADLPSMAHEWAEPFARMAADLALETTTAFAAHAAVEHFWGTVLRHDESRGDDVERRRAIALVRQLKTANGSERQLDSAMAELKSLVPDPNVSDLIYWPSQHDLSKGLQELELTPEVIVELAYRYKPFEL
jgi:predicted nucleotidyltransferase component of viral defense system